MLQVADIFCKRLYSFVTQNYIIYPLQFGFQEKHSIERALISLTETIRNTLDYKKFGFGIFLDLEKLLTQYIMIFYFISWNTMVLEGMPLHGLNLTYRIDFNMFQFMGLTLIY